MKARWLTEHKARSIDGDLLQVVTVFAEGENKEVVKRESRLYTHRREVILFRERVK